MSESTTWEEDGIVHWISKKNPGSITIHQHKTVIGHEVIEILLASIQVDADATFAGPVQVYASSLSPEAQYVPHHLFAGWVTYQEPLSMQGSRILHGPASIIFNYIPNVATVESTVSIEYRRLGKHALI